MSRCDVERKFFARAVATLAVTTLVVLAAGCEDVRQDEPSEDGTCYPAYNQDGEPERGAAGQQCYS